MKFIIRNRCIVLVALLFWAASAAAQAHPKRVPDTASYVVLPATRLANGARPASLSAAELELVDDLLRKAVDAFDKRLRAGARSAWIDLDKRAYKRQYVATINARGEKEVWVNCFCEAPATWRTQEVWVMDGGSCYFQVTLNLKGQSWAGFGINGVA